MSRLAENPFDVLGLRPGCSSVEVERAGTKLLGMLAVGIEEVAVYPTPLGPRPRDADAVRRAMHALRDPAQRRIHEAWAAPPADPVADPPGWPDVFDAIGWGT